MDSGSWLRLREVFARALEQPEADRGVFLDGELAAEPALRAPVEALLRAHADASDFMTPGTAAARRGGAFPDALGTTVGPYRLQQLLGEGLFGGVYLAEQETPLRRQVALKLLKPGMGTQHVIARFEAERQALARMDHPHIAQVYDAGETADGHPYFAMEYVDGAHITDYCDRARLDVPRRLELFLQVCEAVQHAHQKGVIHRDLKPSNVLVAAKDGRPVVKVIDFGVAKATLEPLTTHAMATVDGVVIGTLGYMSPEQAGSSADGIDTRSDIYSLGALLYELLVGAPPFDPDRLVRTAWLEALRVIREEDPPRLASRCDTLIVRGQDVAGPRATDIRGLKRQLNGELEWIALRALEKEPARRYSSASEFAADIRRFQAHEPVLAGPPGTRYRLRKFARRHRSGVIAGLMVFAAVLGGAGVAAVGYRRAARAEAAARQEATLSLRVSDFLVGLFEAPTPDAARGDAVAAATLLERGAERVDRELASDPAVRTRMLWTIGRSYINLGKLPEGVRLLQRAVAIAEESFPPDDPRLGVALRNYAWGLRKTGRSDSAQLVADRSIRVLANGDPVEYARSLLVSASCLGDARELEAADSLMAVAIPLVESAAHPDTVQLALMYSDYAAMEHWLGHDEVALARLKRALELLNHTSAAGGSSTVVLNTQLAGLYVWIDDPKQARPHAEAAVGVARKIFPSAHLYLANALVALASVLDADGQPDSAAVYSEEAVTVARALYGGDHVRLADLITTAGIHYGAAGRTELAIARSREGYEMHCRLLGRAHPRCALTLAHLGHYYNDVDDFVRADSAWSAAVPVLLATTRGRSYPAAEAIADYASRCLEHGRAVQADTLFARAMTLTDSLEAPYWTVYVTCLTGRGEVASRQRRHDDADGWLRRAIAVQTRAAAPDSELGATYLDWAIARARAGDQAGVDSLSARAREHTIAPEEVSRRLAGTLRSVE